ncbi:unnamed protein product [Allacma fusca]|uniref:Nose resistant-to-fluoxetine protein N-terminal domain-containing protein n=1 Tax=Allacma fusca TaxID=39272 RepID=A0A8J2JW13_9HEXA|nr:unnamed protein product [Allacma fusca]
MAELPNFCRFFLFALIVVLHFCHCQSGFSDQFHPAIFNNHRASYLLDQRGGETLDFSKFGYLNEEIRSQLYNLSQSGTHFDLLKKIAEPHGLLDFAFTNVNPVCANHSRHVIRELTGYYLRLPKTWAWQVLDSWGKIPTTGVLSGHVQVPGDFYECLQIRGSFPPDESSEKEVIKGRYCLTYIVPGQALLNPPDSRKKLSLAELNPGLRESVDFLTLLEYMIQPSSLIMFPMMGTCFPSSCSNDDIQMIFSTLYSALTQNYLEQVVLGCETDEKPPLDAGDYSMIVVLAIIVGLCVTGTLVDNSNLFGPSNSKTDGALKKSILAFSITTNTTKWLSTRTGSDNLGCLHGIRFLSMCWVVLGHTFFLYTQQFTWNLVDLKNMYKDWTNQVILNGAYCVDTFFALSGTLVTYNLLRELDKRKGKFNYIMFVVHRYLRLTPTYVILLGLMATLLPYLGNGPGWFLIEQESRMCEASWWHNILYLNNYLSYSSGKVCYGESWYLGNDMMFYWLSPLVIYPLWKWKRIGILILVLVSLMSMIAPFVVTYTKELPPQAVEFVDNKTFWNDVYIKPYTRCGPYVAGILLGYILHLRAKNPRAFRKFPVWASVIGWIACTVTALAIIFGIFRFNDPANYDDLIHSWPSHVYSATHFYLWGCVISWVVFACVNGHGFWINSFLSWKVFMPLGRLTFCMYITSYHLQTIYHTSQPHPGHFNKYNVMNIFFAHLVMSALVSYILTMTLESPFIQLEKILLEPLTRPPKPETIVKNREEENNNNDPNGKSTHVA